MSSNSIPPRGSLSIVAAVVLLSGVAGGLWAWAGHTRGLAGEAVSRHDDSASSHPSLRRSVEAHEVVLDDHEQRLQSIERRDALLEDLRELMRALNRERGESR